MLSFSVLWMLKSSQIAKGQYKYNLFGQLTTQPLQGTLPQNERGNMQLLQRPARGQLQTGRSGSHRRTCRDDRPSDVPSDPVRRNVVPDPVRDLGTSVPGLLSVVRELSAREVRGPFDIVLLDRG